MPQSRRYLLISLCVLFAIGVAWFFLRSTTPVVPEAIKRGYSEALTRREQANLAPRGFFISNGPPGYFAQAPRLAACRTAQLPSSVALKLADAELQHQSRKCALRRSEASADSYPAASAACLGPLLDDSEQNVRFAADDALLGFRRTTWACIRTVEQAIDAWEQGLKSA